MFFHQQRQTVGQFFSFFLSNRALEILFCEKKLGSNIVNMYLPPH